jgi:hypothetical protein
MTDDIARLRELLAKALPLPWRVGGAGNEQCTVIVLSHDGRMVDEMLYDAEGELFLAAVNALPALLDRVEAAERSLKDAQRFHTNERKDRLAAEDRAEAAERRVAELEKREARWVNVKDRPLPECGALVANVDETGFDMWSWWEGESEGRITCWMENCPTLPDLDRAALRGEEE